MGNAVCKGKTPKLPKKRTPCVMLVGGSGCGKSALAQQLVYHEFPTDHQPTIVDGYEKHFVLDDFAARISIVDCGGSDEYVKEINKYVEQASGLIFVVDVTNPDSLDAVNSKYTGLLALRPDVANLPKAVVATKTDSVDRVVSQPDITALAAHWSCPHVETSAQSYDDVEAAFRVLVAKLVPEAAPDGP
ncbi:Ras-1 [Thecamonas trahens ATCC 50062]|uniref:Ras-1 n=1 Tax=Thecamonas trahens ATCC 50062 TaxID=461836 RepID=A0A0L0D8R9_THETB|nr:Ras-1 [Thecamonas trahens ATCC 50062]KNC48734.1 Ras-1 [Thecamonas trahens ATCC 50062]|eukprot:XP_013762786.1 Ras-1 [Thecamonas trahens ATCC 50062]